MAKNDPHFRLRIPADLKAEIEAAAETNERSINAEIIARLRDSSEERILIRSLLSLLDGMQQTERTNIEVMRWMRDQMSLTNRILDEVAATDGNISADLLASLKLLVSKRGQDAGFPLTDEEIAELRNRTPKLSAEARALRERYAPAPKKPE